jgi:hypothetical protein
MLRPSMKWLVFCGLALGAEWSAPQARAELLFSVTEVGSDVVAFGSGSANLTELAFSGVGLLNPAIFPSGAGVSVGLTASISDYFSISGPADFGTGVNTGASSASGDTFGFLAAFGSSLYLPEGYVSGDFLSGTATWTGETFASLGLTPGSYKYTWGSGINADSLTLNIGAAVPEPSTFVVMISTGALMALLRARRRTV